VTTADHHDASLLSTEDAKKGMQWLASWVSSQYMGMVRA
jgi:hypothetical protein